MRKEIVIGFLVTLAVAGASEVMPQGGSFLMLVAGGFATANLFGGLRLPFAVRALSTMILFYFGYQICLLGRTTEPGLTRYTIQWMLMAFLLIGLLPSLTLARIWNGKTPILLLTLIFPWSFLAAAGVAEFEEWQFVRKHASGVGPTARWTVSNHWLSYDAQTKQLHGSD